MECEAPSEGRDPKGHVLRGRPSARAGAEAETQARDSSGTLPIRPARPRFLTRPLARAAGRRRAAG